MDEEKIEQVAAFIWKTAKPIWERLPEAEPLSDEAAIALIALTGRFWLADSTMRAVFGE